MFNSFVDATYTFESAEPRNNKRRAERDPSPEPSGAAAASSGAAAASSGGAPEPKRAREGDGRLPRLQEKKDKLFQHFNKLTTRLQDPSEELDQLRTALDTLQRIHTKKKFYKHLVQKVLPAINALKENVESMPHSERTKKLLKYLTRLEKEARVKQKYMTKYRRVEEQEESEPPAEEFRGMELRTAEDPVEEPAAEEPAAEEPAEEPTEEPPPLPPAEVEEEKSTDVEMTDAHSSRSAPLRWNQWYIVTMTEIAKSLPKKKQNKVIKMLKKGPQRLKLVGIGAGTLTFEENLQVQTSHVHLEPFLVEKTSNLKNGMMIEIKYEGYDWALYQYIVLDGSPTVIPAERLWSDIADDEFYAFDEVEDEWRFPKYASLNVDDVVEVFFALDDRDSSLIPDEAKASGWERVRIMEAVHSDDNTHVFTAEFEPHKNDVLYDNQVKIDVWKHQVRDIEEASTPVSEVEFTSGEEQEEDPIYDEGEKITFQGQRYKIKTVVVNDGEVSYVCVTKGGEEQEITEDDLLSDWNNEFALHEWVIHNGKTKLVLEILWCEKKYRIVPIPNDGTDEDGEDEDEGEMVEEKDLEGFEPMAYNTSRLVIFNWEICEIQTVDVSNREYVLQGANETYRVTDEDLVPWCLQVKWEKGKAPSDTRYVCWRQESPIVRIKSRGPRGKEVPTEIVYIQLMSKVESLKKKPKWKEMTRDDFDKRTIDQEDVNAYLQNMDDESEGEDNGNQIEEFRPGDQVELYDGLRKGTIVRHVQGDIPDNDTFVISVNGQEETVGVGDFGRVEKLSADDEEEHWTVGDHILDEGQMWTVTQISVDGEISWSVVDTEEGKIVTDYRGLDYECENNSWHLVNDPESDTDSEEDEQEQEAAFENDEYVTMKDRDGVFQIESYSGGKYVLKDASGAHVRDVSEDDLEAFESEFEEGDDVFTLPNYEKRKIQTDNGDGTYILDNGNTVDEFDLELYTAPLKGLVMVRDLSEVFEVVSFQGGQYALKHGETITQADMNDVKPYEGPEFEKGDIVQLETGELREVDSFDTSTLLYKLKKGGRGRYRENELKQAPAPKFGRFSVSKNKYVPRKKQLVRVSGEEESHVFKKMDRLNRTYTLDDGRVISEDDLEEVIEEEIDDI